MAGKSIKDLDAVMYETLARCLQKSLQPHVDQLLEESMDDRLKTLIRGHLHELLASLDMAADPLKPPAAKTRRKTKTAEAVVAPAPAQATPVPEVKAEAPSPTPTPEVKAEDFDIEDILNVEYVPGDPKPDGTSDAEALNALS